jgi:hypothetical protein
MRKMPTSAVALFTATGVLDTAMLRCEQAAMSMLS